MVNKVLLIGRLGHQNISFNINNLLQENDKENPMITLCHGGNETRQPLDAFRVNNLQEIACATFVPKRGFIHG